MGKDSGVTRELSPKASVTEGQQPTRPRHPGRGTAGKTELVAPNVLDRAMFYRRWNVEVDIISAVCIEIARSGCPQLRGSSGQ